MITGVHAMFYSDRAEELRAFLRDKLRLPARDSGGGWLIFDVGAADMGVHPNDFPEAPPSGTHAISFQCDDIEATVAELEGRGVEFTDAIQDQGYGFTAHFRMPGGLKVELFQKKY